MHDPYEFYKLSILKKTSDLSIHIYVFVKNFDFHFFPLLEYLDENMGRLENSLGKYNIWDKFVLIFLTLAGKVVLLR